MVDEETQHGIAVQNYSPSDAPGADHASLAASDTKGSSIRDPNVFITLSSPNSLIELNPVEFVNEADFDNRVSEDDAVTSVSGATTPPKSFFKTLFNLFRNGSSDRVDVNAHVGNNDYCAKPKSACGQYPSNEVISQDLDDAILPHTHFRDTWSQYDLSSSPSMSSAPDGVQCCLQTPSYEHLAEEDNTKHPGLE